MRASWRWGALMAVTLTAPRTHAASGERTDQVASGAGPAVAIASAFPSMAALEATLENFEAESRDRVALVPAQQPPGSPAQLAAEDGADERGDEAIGRLETVLATEKNLEVRADVSVQLASLWWEKAGRRVGTRGEAPGDRPRESALYRANAVGLLEQLLKDFPTYPHANDVRFALGNHYFDLSRDAAEVTDAERWGKRSVDSYNAFLALNPGSEQVPQVFINLGRYYFARHDLAHATTCFQEAYRRHSPLTGAYAIYMLAWCHFAGGVDAPPLGSFDRDANHTRAQPDRGALEWSAETVDDLLPAFARAVDASAAIKYLGDELGRDQAVELVVPLARVYFAAGGSRWNDAIESYRFLLETKPDARRAPEWQTRVILAYAREGKRPNVWEEIQRLADRYGKDTPWWAARTSDSTSGHDRDVAGTLLKEALFVLVSDLGDQARRTPSAATVADAGRAGKRYLEAFPGTERAYQVRLDYAANLYALQDYQSALNQYRMLADDAGHPKLTTAEATRMLDAAVKLVELQVPPRVVAKAQFRTLASEDGPLRPVRLRGQLGALRRHRALTPPELQLADALDRYGALVPDPPAPTSHGGIREAPAEANRRMTGQ